MEKQQNCKRPNWILRNLDFNFFGASIFLFITLKFREAFYYYYL